MGPKVPKSPRVAKQTAEEVDRTERENDLSAASSELAGELLKMRRCPGVVFADGPTGRRARIAGTGLDVWEVIATYQRLGQNPKRLGAAYPQLDEVKLSAALRYYECYPKEIDDRVSKNESRTPHGLWARYPFTRSVRG
jgi:uncharacterized protein (DUF433 family)